MADPVAITGIVVSGVVGPSVTAWWAFRRLGREHESARILADRTELRGMLAEAARDLSRSGRFRAAVQSKLLTHGEQTPAQAKATIERFHEALRDADLHQAAIALRLGRDHPVAVAYADAFEALMGTSMAVTLLQGLGSIDGKEAWERMKASDEGYTAAHDRFLAGAHALAAAQLEPRARPRHLRRGSR